MARQLKTNGIYGVTCVVTGEKAGTTPAVFDKRAARYGITPDELKSSYVGRTATKLIRAMIAKGKSANASDAIAAIRAKFGVTGDDVSTKVIDKIMEPVKAKAAAKKATEAFEKTKAAALKELLSDVK